MNENYAQSQYLKQRTITQIHITTKHQINCQQSTIDIHQAPEMIYVLYATIDTLIQYLTLEQIWFKKIHFQPRADQNTKGTTGQKSIRNLQRVADAVAM